MAKAPRRKKPVDSKDKGDRGEYAVRDLLQEWWGTDFAKTPKSGGFSTKKFRRDWNAEADVVTPDESFPFAVEVKWREGWCFEQIITAPKTEIWEWWEQAKGQSEDKLTLLVFKRNYKPWFCMMRVQDDHDEYQKDFIKASPFRVIDRQGKAAYIRLFSDLLAEPIEKWAKK